MAMQDTAMGRPISSDLVGFETDPHPVSWDDRDVLLYACGVGARPETDLDFLYEGHGPKVLPTYAVVPGMLAMAAILGGGVDIDLMMVLHGEQSITLHREIPPRAHAAVTGRISEVWDKEKAAVIGCEGIVADDDGPLFTVKATLFVRGAGGFGGERGPSTAGRNEPPEREPDHVVTMDTRPEQAAIYRLSGDRNPMHIDPAFATAAGFDGPFLHGLCTYGFVGRAVLGTVCDGDPHRFRGFDARFADRVHCGDTITTKIWDLGAGEAIVQAEIQTGAIVLSQARATFVN
jgi:acyl dehydratase